MNKEERRKYGREYIQRWRRAHPSYYNDYQREYFKEYDKAIRLEVLTHYGNDKCACVICGFDNIKALSIDHMNNDGAAFRKSFGDKYICRWLKARGYPKGYQTLCMNCQWLKRDMI